mmetsp:Transcript_65426/g.131594  ORF Transcript_65426/g.131594 Transcript_65426/m.131594 type:complete len:646 (+) Transcript_65426:143-2080(+)
MEQLRISGLVSVEIRTKWKQKMVYASAGKLRITRPPGKRFFRVSISPRKVELDVSEATVFVLSDCVVEIRSVSRIQQAEVPHTTRMRFPNEAERERWVDALCVAGCVVDREGKSKRDVSCGTSVNQHDANAGRGVDGGALEINTPDALNSMGVARSQSPLAEEGRGVSTSGDLVGGVDSSSSPPFIPQTADTPPDEVPTRYLVNSNGNRAEALRRWQSTHAWRKSLGMDEALTQSWPHFLEWKSEYLHCFHRRAKPDSVTGRRHVVFYDRLDLKFLSKMVDAFGGDLAVKYYLFLTDYCYHELEPDDPGGQQVTVYDLSKLTLGSLFGSCVEPCKQIIRHYALHYPERAKKVFLINAPYFFTGIWTSMKPFLDQRVLDSISVSSQGRRDLLAYIGAENVPLCYGGTDACPMGEAPEELMLKAWVAKHTAPLLRLDGETKDKNTSSNHTNGGEDDGDDESGIEDDDEGRGKGAKTGGEVNSFDSSSSSSSSIPTWEDMPWALPSSQGSSPLAPGLASTDGRVAGLSPTYASTSTSVGTTTTTTTKFLANTTAIDIGSEPGGAVSANTSAATTTTVTSARSPSLAIKLKACDNAVGRRRVVCSSKDARIKLLATLKAKMMSAGRVVFVYNAALIALVALWAYHVLCF